MGRRHLSGGVRQDFLDYARRRNFTDSLVQQCLKTLSASVAAGDGALWSDSLLHSTLSANEGRISSLVTAFSGARGSVVADFSFKTTLATQDFIVRPEFQTPLDDILYDYCRCNPGRQIDLDRVFALELDAAIAYHEGDYISVMDYVQDLLSPLDEVRPTSASLLPGRHVIDKFVSRTLAAFCLSLLCDVHPLDAFERRVDLLQRTHAIPEAVRARRFFLRVRDSIPTAAVAISDLTIAAMAVRWNAEKYEAGKKLDERRMEEREDGYELSGLYDSDCLFAARELARRDVPIAAVLQFLEIETEAADNLWPETDCVYLAVGDRDIRVIPTDMLGVQRLGFDEHADRARAQLGIVSPNPFWNEDVVDRFEHLINRPGVTESELQFFFEMYPEFILSDLHVSAIPQITLVQSSGRRLRPDFLLQRANSRFVDIMEIKRPLTSPLIHADPFRPTLGRELQRAISQLRDYRDWFRNDGNRTKLRGAYQLDGFEPTLTLIIGRRSAFPNEQVAAKALEGTGVRALSYDDVLEIVKNRKRLAFGR